MFKQIVLVALVVCSANAGIISTGIVGDGYGLGHGVVAAAPALTVGVAHAPVAVKTAVATSYQNNNLLSVNPTLVKVAAPIAVAHAAPAITVAHAPLAVAHAPVVSAQSYGYGLSYH